MRSGLIEDLTNTDNLLVLITKENYVDNWQSPKSVVKYVRENFKYIEDVGNFDVYRNVREEQ